jgi:3-hydroxyacyl-CoA dehydrogenase/enoyl-CoA hydratase/3-hydroxybutyryl-CoA epimerase
MRILVAGAGKMGRDVGLRFLRSGLDVTWVERSPDRSAAFEKRLGKDIRRAVEEGEILGRASVLVPGTPVEPFDALYEAVDEDLDAKRAVVAEWAGHLVPDGLILSNTSSILPSEIDPRCVGLHAFYPTALTGFCEVVVPADCPAQRRRAVVALAARLGLRPIVQDQTHAFAVNRLMLPVQDWALRAVVAGIDPAAVDAAAAHAWPSWEPLGMMDAIGLDTVAASVGRYRFRMNAEESAAFVVLEEGLGILVAAGKTGAKAHDGIRTGGALPWPSLGRIPPDLGADLEALFRNACARALAFRDIPAGGLALALSGLFGVPYRPADRDLLTPEARERCERQALATGLAYWRPAPSDPGAIDPWSGDGA